jgi:hypothetical protein
VPVEELDLDEEAYEYAERWNAEEDRGDYSIGSAHGEYRPAIIWAVEAARLLCGGVGSEENAVILLRMAADAIEPHVDRDLKIEG